MSKNRRVVIVGAGFGGLGAAMKLSRGHAVTVIDSQPDFEFLPNIHELISGVKAAEQLRLSKRRLIRRAGHSFVQDTVTSLDPDGGSLETASGERFRFDACVVAVGGVNNTFGVPGADEEAYPFKSVEQCAAIGDALRDAMDRKRPVSVVIVGGGLEGVESLGEILRRYRSCQQLSIEVVESGTSLMPGMPGALGKDVEKRARRYPVRFHFGSRVKAVARDSVELESGRVLNSDITIWTGGAAASALLAEAGLAPKSGDWAPVRETLQSEKFDNIFVIGDAAEFPDALAKQSYYATSMGELVAENIERFFRESRLNPFEPSREISLVAFGDLDTYLVLGEKVVAGVALATAKEFIYQFNMARYLPPTEVLPFFDVQARFWSGFQRLALPNLLSPAAFLRLGRVRLLR